MRFLHKNILFLILSTLLWMGFETTLLGQGTGFGGYVPPVTPQAVPNPAPDPVQDPARNQQILPGSGQQGGYIPTSVPNQVPQHAGGASFGSRQTDVVQAAPRTLLPPPFELTPEEMENLNTFLAKWENFSKDIKRVSCEVHVREFDGGVFHQDRKTPMAHTWGIFRFIFPNKLFYHVRGEFVYLGNGPNGEPKSEWKPSSNETKIVYDGKSFTQYDYKKKVATVFPIPEEEQNQDLSLDGPFPLFFIANADRLKEKFYLKIVTPAEAVSRDVWIEAYPRYADDAQEYQKLILLMRLTDLQPYFLRKMNPNGKSHSDLEFQNVAINKGLWNIEASLDLNWTKKVEAPITLNQKGKNVGAKK